MEFAGMINDAERSNYKSEGVPYSDYEANKLLTFHEMMHMYFPFLMGINEKRFAWMEEGMAEFSEDYFTGINLESSRSRARFGKSTITPMMVQTYIDINSGVNSYDIASQSYYALLHLLGKEKFTDCLNGYMDRWKNKHPTPYDYFYSFNDLSGQDLNWFWKAWYFDWGYPDLAIGEVENGKLPIENVGGRPLAFSVNTTYTDGTTKSEMVSPIVWKSATTYEHLVGEKKVKRIELKTLNGADAVFTNNILNLN
jgi:aminopeptidase N